MSDKDGSQQVPPERDVSGAPGTREGGAGSPMDRPTGELPRFGESSELGRVLDPHDDSDTGIGGPVLPRVRGESQPSGHGDAAGAYGEEPGIGQSDPTVAQPALGRYGTGPSGAPEPSSEPTEPVLPSTGPDAGHGAGPGTAHSVPDTSPGGLPFSGPEAATEAIPATPTASTASAVDPDEFGRVHNRRRGRERAAQARAEAEGAVVPEPEPAPDGRRTRRFAGPADELEAAKRASKRGTTDVGLLLLRLAVGAIIGAHGAQHLFGVWGGSGIRGMQQMLENSDNPALGFHHYTHILAIANGVIELGAGVMLVVGVLTPIAASGVVGVMVVASLFKLTGGGNGFQFFAGQGGIEFELLLGVAAAVVILSGPGRIALDYGRGWARRPHAGSVLWLLLGIAGGIVIWVLFNGANPLVKH